jgi:AcrR family transcriptional regulator
MSNKGHREALLDAAKKLIRTRGYGHITARDLVAASNTNLASIGYHFGSKEALLNEAIGEALEEWTDAIGRATQGRRGATALQRITSSWRAVLDDAGEIRPYLLAFLEALAHSARSPELADQLARHYRKQRERVAGFVAGDFGGALDDRTAHDLATLMIAISDGLLIQSFADPEQTPGATRLAAAVAETGGQLAFGQPPSARKRRR